MAYTEVDICNMALSYIGMRAYMIESLSDSSAAAQACQMLYPAQRDELLILAPWPFAVKRATLDLATDQIEGGYAYTYDLPTGCLWPLEIIDSLKIRRVVEKIDFRWEGRVLLTDKEDAVLRYIDAVTDASLFTPEFASALAWKLAIALAGALSADPNNHARLLQTYQMVLLQSRAVVFNSMPEIAPPEAGSIAARS